jgi:hypothetical protein
MQTLQMNNKICPSHAGNSRSLEMPVDNRFTHHHNHHPDTLKEEVEVTEAVEEVVEEADYLLQLGQAYSHHMDEPLTLTNFWAASQRHSQEIG